MECCLRTPDMCVLKPQREGGGTNTAIFINKFINRMTNYPAIEPRVSFWQDLVAFAFVVFHVIGRLSFKRNCVLRHWESETLK